jgi:peptide/nickel transport system permease protein
MNRYIVRRLLISIPVLFGITLTVFILVNVAPGDPISALMDPDEMALMGPEWVEQQRRELGLDRPLPVRYLLWLREISRGNLGFSFNDRRAVSTKIGERIWPTLKLMLAAEGIALLIGLPIGIMSALRQYSKGDYLATIFGFDGGRKWIMRDGRKAYDGPPLSDADVHAQGFDAGHVHCDDTSVPEQNAAVPTPLKEL